MHYCRKDGQSSEGFWKNGKEEGRAIMCLAGGNAKLVEYVNGQLNELGPYKNHKGERIFPDDKFLLEYS